MAYRFLLEVPETLAGDASVTVEGVDDAQVILVRDSHGLGFEEPSANLTIAAHTLRVIDAIYDWFSSLGGSRPDFRIVLHSGDRLALEEYDRGAMVAAIRRDQPWVERSIPKVGEHELDAVFVPDDEDAVLAAEAKQETRDQRLSTLEAAVADMNRNVFFRKLNHITVQVNDLRKAERFYASFLNMRLEARGRVTDRGGVEVLDGGYEWEGAIRAGVEADLSLMRNGPVTLELKRAGRGARLDRGVVDRLSVTVDSTTFANLKGEALMRSMTVMASTPTQFTFLDPFGVVWELTVQRTADTPIL